MGKFLTTDLKDNHGGSSIPVKNSSSNRSETCNTTITRSLEDGNDQRLKNSSAALLVGEWADSLTNISVGDLLAEVPDDLDDNCVDHDKKKEVSSLASHASSIWDSEETCDAFLFQKNPIPRADVPRFSNVTSQVVYKQIAGPNLEESGTLTKESLDPKEPIENSSCETSRRVSI
ncbi:hypothetical protein F3Y22_tig00110118pilonHSYRG00017 [Hibiscus syriacus]|uniref:Uncharacterized protein n=1 Tax=Hibiscus syriacus TaxID=106335 RepID=A0A6A3BLZ0_HIBSY|nr:hypothetical protein F3Y22_tig00110118pilonHSYRG00017 [Hibiscus syriacus]